MKVMYKINRVALKKRDYKNHVTKKSGAAPTTRDTEALSALLKALKKA